MAQLHPPSVEEEVVLAIPLEGAATIEEFIERMTAVAGTIEWIAGSVEHVDKLHRQALAAVNGDESVRVSRLIDERVARTNREAQGVRRALKVLSAETAAAQMTASDVRMRTTQQARLGKKFLKVMGDFQRMQGAYRERYRLQLERQYLIIAPDATRADLDNMVGAMAAGDADDQQQGLSALNQRIFSLANRSSFQRTLAEMRERHDEIVAIERSMAELHQMFLDMATVVEAQGELVDKVEEHVDATAEYTEAAAVQMRGAVVGQRSAQRKRWFLSAVCVVLLVAIGVVIWLAIKG